MVRGDRIISTCKEKLCNKACKGLVNVSPLEAGVPLVLKLMLYIIMDVEDAVLRLLVQRLQIL